MPTGAALPCACSDWQVLIPATLPDQRVRTYMTPKPMTAVPSARIGELAQRMLDAHIHRLIVVDEHGRPIGIVSSTDILAAVAASQRNAAGAPVGSSRGVKAEETAAGT